MRRIWAGVAFATLACGGSVSESGNGNPNSGVGTAAPGNVYDGNTGGAPITSSYYNIGGGAGFPYAGYAGLSEPSGDAGDVGIGSDTDCATAPPAPLPTWQPKPINADESVVQVVRDAQTTIVGDWQGSVSHQSYAPYSVLISFSADGSYSGHCTEHSDYDGSNGCCRALGFGTDKDSPLKQWKLLLVDADQKLSGDLDIIFDYGASGFGESANQGKITDLEFDATGNRARFTFFDGDLEWGSFDLSRLP